MATPDSDLRSLIGSNIDTHSARLQPDIDSAGDGSTVSTSSQRLLQMDLLIAQAEQAIRLFPERIVENRLQIIRKDRNKLIPINNLPVEMMVQILHVTLNLWDNICRLPALHLMRRVSSHWHDVIDSTPSLWSHIVYSDHGKMFGRAMSNSGDHLLTVEYLARYNQKLEHSLQSFAQRLHNHTSRLEQLSLDLVVPYEVSVLQDFMKRPMPVIHTLQMRADHTKELPMAEISPSITMHKLGHLVLEEIALDWKHPFFLHSNLHYLSLHFEKANDPSFLQFVHILRHFAQLQHLDLKLSSWSRPSEDYQLMDQTPIALNHLSSLHFSVPARFLLELLSILVAPHCSSIRIYFHTYFRSAPRVLMNDILVRLAALLESCIPDDEGVTIGVQRNDYNDNMTASWNGCDIEVDSQRDDMVGGVDPVPFFVTFFATMRSIRPAPRIGLKINERYAEYLVPVLPSFESVSSFAVDSAGEETPALLAHLGQCAVREGMISWPLPNLSKIVVNGVGDRRVLNMLQGRYAVREDSWYGSGVVVNRCRPLELLTVDYLEEEIFDEIRDLIGPGHLNCERGIPSWALNKIKACNEMGV